LSFLNWKENRASRALARERSRLVLDIASGDIEAYEQRALPLARRALA